MEFKLALKKLLGCSMELKPSLRKLLLEFYIISCFK